METVSVVAGISAHSTRVGSAPIRAWITSPRHGDREIGEQLTVSVVGRSRGANGMMPPRIARTRFATAGCAPRFRLQIQLCVELPELSAAEARAFAISRASGRGTLTK